MYRRSKALAVNECRFAQHTMQMFFALSYLPFLSLSPHFLYYYYFFFLFINVKKNYDLRPSLMSLSVMVLVSRVLFFIESFFFFSNYQDAVLLMVIVHLPYRNDNRISRSIDEYNTLPSRLNYNSRRNCYLDN